MNITVNEREGLDFSHVEIGDLVLFCEDAKKISNVYIICYNDDDKYHLQNINGSRTCKSKPYPNIDKMLRFRHDCKIVKSKDVNLEITKIFMEL